MPVTIPERLTSPEKQAGGGEPIATPPANPPLWKRLGWFALLYAVGVGSVGLVAFGLRLWIKP